MDVTSDMAHSEKGKTFFLKPVLINNVQVTQNYEANDAIVVE